MAELDFDVGVDDVAELRHLPVIDVELGDVVAKRGAVGGHLAEVVAVAWERLYRRAEDVHHPIGLEQACGVPGQQQGLERGVELMQVWHGCLLGVV